MPVDIDISKDYFTPKRFGHRYYCARTAHILIVTILYQWYYPTASSKKRHTEHVYPTNKRPLSVMETNKLSRLLGQCREILQDQEK